MNTIAYGRSDGRKVSLRAQLPLVDSGSHRTWVQFALEGTWDGHPAGTFTFDRAVFEQIKATFERQANAIPLTYEHPERGSGQPVPAAGWIHELAIRGKELWGLVEFTPRAAEMVKSGEYRFCSVVVDFESTDRTTGDVVGPELYEVGLTNTPFLDGMAPITLSRRRRLAREKDTMSDIELIKAALKELGDDATLEQVTRWVAAKKELDSVASGEGDAPAEEPAEMSAETSDDATVELADPPAESVELMEGEEAPAADGLATQAVQLVADAAGVDVAAVIAAMQENPSAFAAVVGGAPDDGTQADEEAAAMSEVSAARVVDLTKRVKASGEELAKQAQRIAELEAEVLDRDVSAAVEAGHILDAEAATLRKFTRSSPKVVRDRLEEAKASPEVPAGKPVKASRPRGAGFDAPADTSHPEWETYERSLSSVIKDPEERARVIAERISTRTERRASRRSRRAE